MHPCGTVGSGDFGGSGTDSCRTRSLLQARSPGLMALVNANPCKKKSRLHLRR